MDTLSFAPSSAIDVPIRVRIVNLEGDDSPFPASALFANPALRHLGSNTSPNSELFLTVQVFSGGKPLAVPVQTAYKPFRTDRRWSEWLELPVKYSSLQLNSYLAVTIWDVSPAGGKNAVGHDTPFGGTTIPLFDRHNQLLKGHQKCIVHRLRSADAADRSTTPAFAPARPAAGRVRGGEEAARAREEAIMDERLEEFSRMEALFKKHELGEIPRVDWLDQLVFRGSEKRGHPDFRALLHARLARRGSAMALARAGVGGGAAAAEEAAAGVAAAAAAAAAATKDEHISDVDAIDTRPGPSYYVLNVELPRFDFPVVFTDHEYPAPRTSRFKITNPGTLKPQPPELRLGPGIHGMGVGGAVGPGGGDGGDDEHEPARLFRLYDPEAAQRENPSETKHRRLFRSVHRQAITDKDLKPNAKVRDELNVILSYSPTHVLTPEETDLVWKFRYYLTRDKRALTKFAHSVNWQDQSESRQAVRVIASWTEIDVDDALELLGPSFDNDEVRTYAVNRLRKADDDELLLYLLQLVQALKYEPFTDDDDDADDAYAAADDEDDDDDDDDDDDAAATAATAAAAASAAEARDYSSLARFLIARAATNPTLGNFFYWYLMVEIDDRPARGPDTSGLYLQVAYDFMRELLRRSGGVQARRTLLRQAQLVTVLSNIAVEIKRAAGPVAKKTERARQLLADPKNELLTIDPPLPLPLDPSVTVAGVYPEQTTVFKSSLSPVKITFRTVENRPYAIIFKVGDDLRQDQLVVQIITLMDRLLQKENLDLRLSPYRILATSTTAGVSQFVPSATLSSIASKFGGANPALAYLKHHNPDPRQPLGLRLETLDTYVRSCAGYCVITYILGVGDRHLDNLLLTPDGHFFHADFGYILGRDPKPFAPVMKLSREMVECMGGVQSECYRQFKQYCFLAFAALRKQSNLLLNLFSLMVDANVPDIRLEPDKAVLKVRDRLHLDLNEEDAIAYLDRIIEGSPGAIAPVVIDKLHELAQRYL